jgi:hypothetical protein
MLGLGSQQAARLASPELAAAASQRRSPELEGLAS